jgi:hypothetical protein
MHNWWLLKKGSAPWSYLVSLGNFSHNDMGLEFGWMNSRCILAGAKLCSLQKTLLLTMLEKLCSMWSCWGWQFQDRLYDEHGKGPHSDIFGHLLELDILDLSLFEFLMVVTTFFRVMRLYTLETAWHFRGPSGWKIRPRKKLGEEEGMLKLSWLHHIIFVLNNFLNLLLLETALFHCVCTNPRQTDLGLLQCEASDSLPELWHGLIQDVSYLSVSV